MATETNQYRPDYAVPPGAILEERLAAHGISHAEFARRCGRSAKLISEIISGKAPVEPATALQFEKVLGVDAGIWLGIEKDYQLHRAREAEAEETEEVTSWVQAFPLKELIKRRVIERPASNSDAVSRLLTFFGVGSVNAWCVKYERMSVAYRHSPSFASDKTALATWLRLGELEAEQQECGDYNTARFKTGVKGNSSTHTSPGGECHRKGAAALQRHRRCACARQTSPKDRAQWRGLVAHPS